MRRANSHLVHEPEETNENLEQKVLAKTLEVNAQKQEIEKLIRNILPDEVALELKEKDMLHPIITTMPRCSSQIL